MDSSPKYETEQDLRNEDLAKKIIEVEWNCELVKLSAKKYRVDFAANRNGKLVAWVEYKRYNTNAFSRHEYMVNTAKFMDGVQKSDISGVPFILVLQYDDMMVYAVIKRGMKCEHRFIDSRSKRGDEFDYEPMTYIPKTWFKTIYTSHKA